MKAANNTKMKSAHRIHTFNNLLRFKELILACGNKISHCIAYTYLALSKTVNKTEL